MMDGAHHNIAKRFLILMRSPEMHEKLDFCFTDATELSHDTHRVPDI